MEILLHDTGDTVEIDLRKVIREYRSYLNEEFEKDPNATPMLFSEWREANP